MPGAHSISPDTVSSSMKLSTVGASNLPAAKSAGNPG